MGARVVEAQSGLSQSSDRGAGKGKDAQGRGRESPGFGRGWLWSRLMAAVAVSGGRSWETQGFGRGFARGGRR